MFPISLVLLGLLYKAAFVYWGSFGLRLLGQMMYRPITPLGGQQRGEPSNFPNSSSDAAKQQGKTFFNLNRRDLGVKLGSYLLVLEIVEKLQNIRNLNFNRSTQSQMKTIHNRRNYLISNACVRRLQVLEDPIARILKGGVAGGDGTGGLALAPVGKIQKKL